MARGVENILAVVVTQLKGRPLCMMYTCLLIVFCPLALGPYKADSSISLCVRQAGESLPILQAKHFFNQSTKDVCVGTLKILVPTPQTPSSRALKHLVSCSSNSQSVPLPL